MKNILLGITTAGLLFTACNNSSQPDKDPSLAVPSTEATNSPATLNGAASETINNQVTPMPVTSTPGVGSLTAGLNPEHGQPNHRCDIAVGAPLSSPAPAAGAVQAPSPVSAPMPSTVQPTMPTVPKSVIPTSGAASGRINPAHGAPGHDCAVAVGAALP